MKKCSRCGEFKEDEDFYKYKDRPYGKCKSCSIEYTREYEKRHPEKVRNSKHRARARKYNLSYDEYERLPDRCEICEGSKFLHIDHDHTTGIVRGVLCRDCNLGLGRFKDDPELLFRAADYLKYFLDHPLYPSLQPLNDEIYEE